MGKARQSRSWDRIRELTKWEGTKEEFEAVMGPIKNFDFTTMSPLEATKAQQKMLLDLGDAMARVKKKGKKNARSTTPATGGREAV